MHFEGSQSLGGNGTVIFRNYGPVDANALQLSVGGTALTIGPGITVRGQNGTIGYAPNWKPELALARMKTLLKLHGLDQ